MNKKIIILLVLITFIGGLLRMYKINENPVSLTVDEVAFGYNAYSILKTARDEYGKFLPLTFKSVGDYKNPVPVYTMVPSIALFGLNEFGERFPTALFSILSIPLFFLIFRKLFKNDRLSLVGAFLLAISPWHIYFSRFFSDQIMASFFIGAGVYSYIKMLEGKDWWAVIAALFFTLSTYTYYAERLFIPLFLLALVLINIKEFLKARKKLVSFALACFIFEIPLLHSTFFGPDISRANMVFITKDIEFTRNVLLYGIGNISNVLYFPLLFFHWVRKYLAYFSPSFLFYSGLPLTSPGSYGMGVLYLFEFITLPLGVYSFIKGRGVVKYKEIILAWLFLGIIPASLTNNEQHPGRTVFLAPVLVIFSALGLVELFRMLRKIHKLFLRAALMTLFSLFFFWCLAHAYLSYTVYFPLERDEDFMDGTKEAVEYMLQNQQNYKEIVFDPYRGVVAPNIVSIPHMYILFYSKYDPKTYQTETKKTGDEYFSFGKYTIRKINWPKDRDLKGVMFIGSPWSLDEKGIDKSDILKKIYLKSGDLALIIVRSHE